MKLEKFQVDNRNGSMGNIWCQGFFQLSASKGQWAIGSWQSGGEGEEITNNQQLTTNNQ